MKEILSVLQKRPSYLYELLEQTPFDTYSMLQKVLAEVIASGLVEGLNDEFGCRLYKLTEQGYRRLNAGASGAPHRFRLSRFL